MVGAPELAESLSKQFALGEGQLEPIYALKRPGQPLLVTFDQRRERVGPTGRLLSFRTFVVVRGPADQRAPSMRVSARRGKVIESLEASRSGAFRLALDDDPRFDESVSVYARDVRAATSALTRPVREVLLRLLGAADRASVDASGGASEASTVAPSLVVGQRDLLLCLEPRGALPLGDLGGLLADMLSLHVALERSGRLVSQALLE